MSNANAEQRLAIEHRGGVLLKAGAGSGKTFVLIEHITYLVNEWIKEFNHSGKKEFFRSYLKSKFSKIVLMTFTKMAAGEISIRLFEKFRTQVENVEEHNREYWKIASELVDSITVSTIHGFCFKLIRQGFFKDIDAEDEMLNDIEFKLLLETLFDRWIDSSIKNCEVSKNLIELMIKDKEQILESLVQIIGDPSLRIMWQDLQKNGFDKQVENEMWKALFDEEGINEIFDIYLDVNAVESFKGNKWADFLLEFQNMKSSSIDSREKVSKYLMFFKSLDYKIPRSPTAKAVSDDLKAYYVKIKNVSDFFKNYGEDFFYYITHYDQVVSTWFSLMQNLVDFVDVEYARSPGLTFADLEYMVWKGLKDPETVKHIGESFDYFIVDEFQDTSYIQFEILEALIQKDFSKLFCVGDVKQAIYGFRGGELGVFIGCQQKVPKVLSLKNNYRSLSDIIHFNNNFFEYVFAKGVGYEGYDSHSVEVEYQNPPNFDMDTGKVYPLTLELNHNEFFEDDQKISNREIEFVEALRILEEIKVIKNNFANDQVAILYKRLRPAQQLIYLLLKNEIGFTAQIKVPYVNDPIIGMFFTLIQKRFDINNNQEDFAVLLIAKYLELLGNKNVYDFKKITREFEEQENYFGVFQAFLDFLGRLGISNSNYKNNLEYLNSVINLAGGNFKKLLLLLQDGTSSTYSMNFQSGINPEKVVIMTAHASKGLQFDHVILGGIYTNDARMPSSPLFGKLPMSLQWSLQLEGKKRFKTPQFIYEQLLNKKKEFSESKRLFYVACTRAKKTLSWVQNDTYKMKTPQKGAWVNGLFKWQSDLALQPIVVNTLEGQQLQKIEFDTKILNKMENSPPLFHIDTLGTVTRLDDDNEIMPIAELSVTRLASIADCPRKFYLKNICKLSDEDLDLINASELEQYTHDDEDGLTSSSFKSNAQRGSLIHKKLSEIILNNFIIEDLDKSIEATIKHTVKKLKNYSKDFEFISEKSIKFELFGHMISGIPDLLLRSIETNQISQIWDFKTGIRNIHKEDSYWFQLYSYAYAAYHLKLTTFESPIKILLYYVDTKEIAEQDVSFQQVEDYLAQYWSRIKRPWETNLEHCSRCSYSIICHK